MGALLVAVVSLSVAADPVHYELEGNVLKAPGPVLFEVGNAKLKAESDAVLEFVKGYLEAKSYLSVLRVEVHTDDMGDRRANQELSEARAVAVVEALVKKGVACGRQAHRSQ